MINEGQIFFLTNIALIQSHIQAKKWTLAQITEINHDQIIEILNWLIGQKQI